MKIKFINGPNAGTELEFVGQTVTIGRDSGNLVCLDSDGVSRCHAELYQNSDGSWLISDRNSTNGVKINRIRISGERQVAEGDLIDIGEQKLQLFDLEGEPAQVIFNPIITAPIPDDAPESDTRTARLPLTPGPERTTTLVEESAVTTVLEESATTVLEETSDAPPPPAPPSPSAILGNMKTFSGSLFSRSGRDAGEPASGAPEEQRKKRSSNRLFYVVLICVVVMVISSVLNIMAPKKAKNTAARQAPPLEVRYEKEQIRKDNVFRFEFRLENKLEPGGEEKLPGGRVNRTPPRRAYTATFTIDDIGSQRHFQRTTPLTEETVAQLRAAIHASGIYDAAPENNPPDAEQNRSLLIVEGGRILKFHVPGKFANRKFSDVEAAIIDVAEGFRLQTIALSPEELLSQAKVHFLKAEDLFDNRAAKRSNLRDAIIRYRAVVDSLEQFSPKPRMWERAGKQLAGAEQERKRHLERLDAEYNRLKGQRQFREMRQIFLDIMELTEPESREYAAAKRRLFIIDRELRKKR